MKNIDLQFVVENEPKVSDDVAAEIKKHYHPIPPIKLDQLWSGTPNRVKLSIDVSGTGVSIFDDWMCTLFGHSYIDCFVALCAVHGLLVDELGKKVTIKIAQPTRGLDKLIRGQRLRRRLIRVGWIAIGVVIVLAINSIWGWIQTILQQRGAP